MISSFINYSAKLLFKSNRVGSVLIQCRFLSPKQYEKFGMMIQRRKKQSKRSILIQVTSEYNCGELYEHCQLYGKTQEVFYFRSPKNNSHFVLVEFKSEADVNKVLSSCLHLDLKLGLPIESTFLLFKSKEKSKRRGMIPAELKKDITYCYTDFEDMSAVIKESKTISDQILVLYDCLKLKEIDIRLRFLVSRQIETALSGIFPKVCAYPFGSSMSGFGKLGCDLDLVIKLSPDIEQQLDSRFVFHGKTSRQDERSLRQSCLGIVSNIMQSFLPGCTNIKRIFQARVPIIKCHHNIVGIDCDLSMTDMTAFYMTELLYMFGIIDNRVGPLVFVVRQWARDEGLTHNVPGPWITNFTLTLLVVFFLQQPKSDNTRILPTLDFLYKNAGPSDHVITREGVNCSYLRDISLLTHETSSTSKWNLECLFLEFFEFYSHFKFEEKGISIVKGKPIIKPDYSSLYVVNPIERNLNVSKNVSREEIVRFTLKLKETFNFFKKNPQQFKNKTFLSYIDSNKNLNKKSR